MHWSAAIDSLKKLQRIGLPYDARCSENRPYAWICQIGEAAARVSDEVKESHPDLPWHEMVGMRNVLTHEYFRVKPIVLYETVRSEFVAMEKKLEELQRECPL